MKSSTNPHIIGEGGFDNSEHYSPTSTPCTTVVGKHQLNRISAVSTLEDKHVSGGETYRGPVVVDHCTLYEV